MFKFNFGKKVEKDLAEDQKDYVIDWYECKKIEIQPEMVEKLKNSNEEELISLNYDDNITLTCLSPTLIVHNLKSESGNMISDILEAEKNHSDLIPGKYEGGMKVWECTRDLVNYILHNVSESFSERKVLDLGCGAGILGIIALHKGASVTFQDYNHEVIEFVTAGNVFLNMKNSNEFYTKTEFFSGDWGSFLSCMLQSDMSVDKEPFLDEAKKFDYILSSETIYNLDNYDKIYRIVKQLMKNDGVCYIAAKKCYFGVGGNIQCFTEYMKKENVFNIKTCWSSNEGVAREILEINFRN